MKIGYKNIYIEFNVSTAVSKITNFLQKCKNQIDFSSKKKYSIALVIELNSFVYQTGILKISKHDFNDIISHFNAAEQYIKNLRRPFLEDILEEKYLLEVSGEYGYNDFDYKDYDFYIMI